MSPVIQFPGEERSNAARRIVAEKEPVAQRTFTPSLAVIAKSAGAFHWTPEGRRLYDYSSGVLVANLGHNPRRWLKRFAAYLGWTEDLLSGKGIEAISADEFFSGVALTAYNAITPIEAKA